LRAIKQILVSLGVVAATMHLPTMAAAGLASTAADFGQLPLRFEPNVGQAPATVKYTAESAGYRVALTPQGAYLSLPTGRLEHAQLRLSLAGASSSARMAAEHRLPTVTNYFLGSDRSQWRRGVPNFGTVRYQDVYPGVDWVIYGNHRHLEYDLVVAPHADPSRIRLQVDGAEQLSLDDNGDLLVRVRGQTLRQLKPVIYQSSHTGAKHYVAGHFTLSDREIGIAIGGYDPTRELIIDPVLIYSTYLGGSSSDSVTAIAVNSAGEAYVAGYTSSPNFPSVKPVSPAGGVNGGSAAFVAKFDSTGKTLLFATYVGGGGVLPSGDRATGLALDGSGNAYITGYTYSTTFPTVHPIQAKLSSTQLPTAFVAKLDSGGGSLAYSTYLGGRNGADYGTGIAVSSTGEAFVVGKAGSSDFRTQFGSFQILKSGATGFVAKLTAAGNALAYSTYLGGTTGGRDADLNDGVFAVAVDSSGAAYVAGSTFATNFPTVSPIQATNRASGGLNAFVTKLDPNGNSLMYSTYLGGSVGDRASAIAVDSTGNAYVTGSSLSPDFPLANAFQSKNNAKNSETAFVSKLSSTGTSLVFSTYLGGSTRDVATAIAVDSTGSAAVAGYSFSSDFPVASPVQSTNHAAAAFATNGFLAQFNAAGSALTIATYLGGSASAGTGASQQHVGDGINAIALGKDSEVFVAGAAGSFDFPLANAFQSKSTVPDTQTTGFVTKINMTMSTDPTTPPTGSPFGKGGGAIDWVLLALLGVGVAARLRASFA